MVASQTRYTDSQREEALLLLAQVGKAEASRRTGIPSGTIASWGHRLGVSAPHAAVLAKANAIKALTLDARKAALAERMLTEAERILGQLNAPMTERMAKVVNRGHGIGSEVEIVDVVHDAPPTADQKRIIDAVAVLIAQVQLLTGEATSRNETTTTVAEAKERATTLVADLRTRLAA